ncbi:sensor domain-containing diguanylate cyclase [Fervidobacterium islandicum]|uniref:Sensor domain-containing diguanylate cyclase n=1 Tax=Fervidobacterium islandicum TaxID=2423 RepID=A0AAI8GDI8_FERIS|nr:sensor domain-containing diguanylate cyclase [Fervidobacterium islandicum]AMW33318.1 sensor domain-containing diguanylate cyclase [Fervidobacterium islandicum]
MFEYLRNWRYVLLILISVAALVLMLNVYIRTEDDSIRKIAKLAIENEARTLSFSYFQWTELYEAILKNDKEFIENVNKMIKKDNPYVVSIEFVSVNPPKDFYEITSEGDLLVFKFKITDSFAEKFIADKMVVVKIRAEDVLSKYQIKGVRIVSGTKKLSKDFVYGLKFERPLSTKEISFLLTLIVLLFSIVLLINTVQTQRLLKTEEILSKSLEAIAEMSQGLLKGILMPSYQFILEKAVEIIPGAQAGSVLVKKDEFYEFAACVGYDFSQLSKAKFRPEELAQSMDGQIKIVTKLDNFDSSKITDERLDILVKYGRILEIKAMLSIPIIVKDKILAFLNLDNFESEKAFDRFSVKIATVFANQIGVIFERIKLEEELQKQKEYLEYISLRDPLTDLPNRRALETEAERMLALADREGKQVCVIYVDLKNFKPVNDRFGHKVGDCAVSIIGHRLISVARKSDFVARVGGDEFVYLLYDCKEYLQFIERVIKEIEKPIDCEGNIITVSANFGISIYPKDAKSFGDLLLMADVAMYHAKNNGLYFYLASNLKV